MKNIMLSFLVFGFLVLQSQDDTPIIQIEGNQLFKKGALFAFNFDPGTGVSLEQRIRINKIIEQNKKILTAKDILKTKFTKDDILFDFPIELKDGLNDPGFYSISGYVDHDLDYPGHLQDYMCGELTYDLENGYNHQGTDYYLWPFPWLKMDNNEVKAIAAAPGIIIFKQDGNYDRNCNADDVPWNAVYLQHSNGYTTWYGHLKNGSLTDKSVGQEVEAGEYLGIVGSSGISITPHLHFEVHDELNNIIDPYKGPCNPMLSESLWAEQKLYIDAGINKISTNNKLPVFPECPLQEILNESDSFMKNDTIFLLAYFRNLSIDDTLKISIHRPDNSVLYEWWWKNEMPFYTASWNYWFIKINGEPNGLWKYKVKYKDEIYEHEFNYSNSSSVPERYTNNLTIFPNPATDLANISFPFPLSEYFAFQVRNIYGQIPAYDYKLGINKKSIVFDCKELKKGIYLITLEDNNNLFHGKLIKE